MPWHRMRHKLPSAIGLTGLIVLAALSEHLVQRGIRTDETGTSGTITGTEILIGVVGLALVLVAAPLVVRRWGRSPALGLAAGFVTAVVVLMAGLLGLLLFGALLLVTLIATDRVDATNVPALAVVLAGLFGFVVAGAYGALVGVAIVVAAGAALRARPKKPSR